ncbi:MAG TPA: hypothetical protein VHC69_24360 [Polyangiaceae bacterium]|nr:hypothetical protein [Polyangiaceae bacterium]
MDYSEQEHLPDAAPHEIVIDDGLEQDSPSSASYITPIALFIGLLLTLMLSRAGIRFFFLPIILPFGIGGGRLLRQFLPPPRRVLRLRGGTLWLASEGPWKTTIVDRLDVGSGAFVALGTTGLWISGLEDARVRVVSSDGALTIPVRGGERARTLRQEIAGMFEAEELVALAHDMPLQGDVWAEPFEDGEQIEWSSGGPSSGLFASRSATALRVTPEAWALRVRSGGRPVVSTGGPGALEARLIQGEHSGPLGASVARDTLMLDLSANGESVGQVGSDLSEPELRWIAERIERAARRAH